MAGDFSTSGDMLRLNELLCWFNRELIKALYPGLGRVGQKRLGHLCREKSIVLVDVAQAELILDRLLCSVIRHNFTHYDTLVEQVEKYKARAIIQPVIALELEQAKGGFSPPAIKPSAPVDADRTMSMEVFENRPKVKRKLAVFLNNPSFIDFTGQRIGHFTVIGMSEAKKGRWVLECDCGLSAFTTAKNIKAGMPHTQKCEVCRGKDQGE